MKAFRVRVRISLLCDVIHFECRGDRRVGDKRSLLGQESDARKVLYREYDLGVRVASDVDMAYLSGRDSHCSISTLHQGCGGHTVQIH